MKVLTALVLALVLAVSPAAAALKPCQRQWGQKLGLAGNLESQSLSMNTTDTWLAISFVTPPETPANSYMSEAILYFGANVGTPTVTATLYSDNAGVPGTEVQATNAVTVTENAWNTFSTGWTATAAVTADTMYWIVFKNTTGSTTATPALAYLPVAAYLPPTGAGSGSGFGWTKTTCTDGSTGPTWGAKTSTNSGLLLTITDGTDTYKIGLPFRASTVATGATEKVYTNAGNVQEFGVKFTSPANAAMNVRGVCFRVRKAGTPTGDARFRIYTGSSTTPLGTTSIIPMENVGSAVWYELFFPSHLDIPANTVVRVTLSNTAADDDSNYFYTYKTTLKDDATWKAFMPFGGLSSTARSGSNWTDNAAEFVPFLIVLDTAGEFDSSGGGGVPSSSGLQGVLQQ